MINKMLLMGVSLSSARLSLKENFAGFSTLDVYKKAMETFTVIAQLRYLKVDPRLLFSMHDIRISYGLDILRHFIDEDYEKVHGLAHVQSYKDHPAFGITYTEMEIDDDYSGKMAHYTNLVTMELREFFNCMWLVKDNCVTIENISAHSAQRFFTNRPISIFSLSTGEMDQIEFSLIELQQAKIWLDKVKPLTSAKRNAKPIYDIKLGSWTTTAHINAVAYNDKSVIELVFDFLTWARAESYVPYKISLYMIVFECLFSTESGEVTYKIALRAATYLGGSYNDKIETYKTVKRAYSIRSTIFHGNILWKKNNRDKRVAYTANELSDLCREIDSILRATIQKLLMNDLDVFSSTVKSEQLEAFFLDLVLKAPFTFDDSDEVNS